MPQQSWTTLASDGEMRAVVTLPDASAGAGLAIIHGGWAIEPDLLVLAQRFAAAGYASIVPDLFHRDPPELASQPPLERIARLTWAGAKRDVEAAVRHLRGEIGPAPLAVFGYCMGGALAWMCGATMDFRTCIVLYPHEVFGPFGADKQVPFELTPRLKIPVLGHFGADDKNPTVADMQPMDEALTAQGTPHEFHVYEGAGHGFVLNSVSRTSHRPEQSKLAVERTIGWFDRHLGATPAPA